MMILERSSLHEEIHKKDHHEKVVFLVILQNFENCLEKVIVLGAATSMEVFGDSCVDGASWSMEVDTGESAKTTALRAATSRTGETTIVGGLKYSLNIGFETSPELDVAGVIQ
ncbi:hypothetical protein Tco_0766658 [Tanacetum coccineum]